jgi:hypothetical protein
MNLIQVNRLDAQPAQRRVQRPGQMPRGQPGAVGRIIQREAALGGQHHRLSDPGRPAGQPAADDLLRPPVAVHISRVDQRAARRNEMVKLLMRARLVSLHPEGHRSQAKGRHRAAAIPQGAIVHGSTYATPAVAPAPAGQRRAPPGLPSSRSPATGRCRRPGCRLRLQRRAGCQLPRLRPPSTMMRWPVMKPAPSEARSGPDEGQQVGVDRLGLGGRHAMRESFVRLQRPVPHELRG